MNFINPDAFWFAAAIPVVIVFYLLKRKRVSHLVSSTVLWQRFLAETQASAPFQRLRKNWLLVLQLLLLALVIFALSRPFFASKRAESALRVVILDASASMQSVDESPSRFDKARAEALKLVDAMPDADQMVILLAGAQTQVKQSPTSQKSALRRALESCQANDGPTRLAESLKLAQTLIQNRDKAEIHLFSDGVAGGLEQFEDQALPIVYHKVGQRGNNVAVTALDVRANPENAAERAVFVSVSNFSSNRVETQIEFQGDGRLLEAKPLALPPGETAPQVFFARQETRQAIFSVKVDAPDDLTLDNTASIVSLLPPDERVLLLTKGNGFLSKAIRVLPHVQLTEAAQLADPAAAAQPDVVILDDVVPAAFPPGNVLAFRAAQTNWFASMQRLESPAIVDWKANHPLLRFVTFDNVEVAEALSARAPGWAVPLVEAPQGPLILAGDFGRQRIVWVGFEVTQSTWPLRVSFPIFIANALEWLNPASIQSHWLTIKTGDAFRSAWPSQSRSAKITLPDGSVRQLEAGGGRELVFGETWKQGVYRIDVGTNAPIFFCANLLDSSESNTKPKDELRFGTYTRVAAAKLTAANLELWRWIALAGLAVLLWEWWFYHRRTA